MPHMPVGHAVAAGVYELKRTRLVRANSSGEYSRCIKCLLPKAVNKAGAAESDAKVKRGRRPNRRITVCGLILMNHLYK